MQAALSQFNLTDGTKWSYEYPVVIDGTWSPTAMTVTMSASLQPFVQSTSTSSLVTLSYDGKSGIGAFAEQFDLFINLNLKDAKEKTATDYKTFVVVTAK